MKMKRMNRVKRKSVRLLFVTAVLLLLISACVQMPTQTSTPTPQTSTPTQEHTHSYKKEWSNNATQHWRECASCGEKTDVEEHEFSWEIKTQATCETPLVEEGACACGYETTRTGEIAGHTLTMHNAQAATCTQGGWSAYEDCSKCSYSTKVEIGAKGHSYSSAWTKDETQHWHACGRCGDQKDAGEHTYGSGVISGAKKIYTCTACNDKKETKLADGVKETMYGTANSAVVLDGDRSYTVSAVKTEIGVFIYAEGVFNTSVSNATTWYENTNFEFKLNGGVQSYVTAKNQSDKVTDFTYIAERLSSGKYLHTAEIFVEKSLISGWSASADVQLNYAWKTPTENAAILSDMADYRYLSEWGNNTDWHSYQTYGCLATGFNDLPANLFISSSGLTKETAPTTLATIDGALTSSELSQMGAEELNVTGNSPINVKGTVADGDLYLAFTITHGAWSDYTQAWYLNDNIELYIDGVHTVVLFINGQLSIPCHITQGAAKTVTQSGKQVTVVELYVKGEQDSYRVSANANGAGFGWNDISWGVSGEEVAIASSAGLAVLDKSFYTGIRLQSVVKETTLSDGIYYQELSYVNRDNNPVKAFAVEVTAGKGSFYMGLPNDSNSLTMNGDVYVKATVLEEVTAAANNGKNVVAGINADFFVSDGDMGPRGLCIKDGVLLRKKENRPFFAVLKDGTTAICLANEYASKYEGKGLIQNAFGGRGMLLYGGEIYLKDTLLTASFGVTRNPRTAIGIRPDGSVVMLVVDGRNETANGSYGATLIDLALMLQQMGCTYAMNFDGGGSSTMVTKSASGYAINNTPSGGSARAIANSLLVIPTKQNGD